MEGIHSFASIGVSATDCQATLVRAERRILLMLSLFVTALALRTGRTIILHGVVLLVVFAVYLFTTVVP